MVRKERLASANAITNVNVEVDDRKTISDHRGTDIPGAFQN